MSEETDLALPKGLSYPIKIKKLLVSPGDTIKRGTELLWYSFNYGEETRYGTWDSSVEGQVNFWNVDIGDEIDKDYGPVLVVTEPCKHGIQIAGMCANCGKDMTEVDYMSNADSQRAKIKMDHSGEGPLMSIEEAAKIERENTKYLISQRKLSLIVDLDQTILHATVDPTVGEWLREKKISEYDSYSTTPPPESVNFPALEDVVKFQLADDPTGIAPPHPSSPWYYVKPRPGLTRFMSKISQLYEMHVYTMGTRSYANAVCTSLDPSGKWFGHRVLTRSESGSDRYKNLQRLFPSDQSMVVIIDDRADVWGNSPNLVRVIAFEFFAGTGDINSTTLPKDPSKEEAQEKAAVKETTTDEGKSEEDDVSNRGKAEDEHAEYIHKTQEERPLAKAQEHLNADVEQKNGTSKEGSNERRQDSLEHRIRKAILNDDDQELERVEAILEGIHERYYALYDKHVKARSNPLPDVARIIPARKTRTFEGAHIVFSGLIPMADVPENSPIWKAAVQFGATCHRDLNQQVTHLVAAKPGTAKVDKAFETKTVKVVSVQWFNDSIAKWQHQPEEKYLMLPPQRRPGHSSKSSAQSSSKGPPKEQTQKELEHVNGSSKVNGETKKSEETVSAPATKAENGAKPSASSTANGQTKLEERVYSPAAEPESTQDEAGVTDLHIDWAELDKELEDELGDMDDDDTDAGTPRGNDTDNEIDNAMVTSRGVKRRRSNDSTPTTPSRLRFSITAAEEEKRDDEDTPSSKRRRIEDITSIVKGEDARPSGEDVSVHDEDDEDFLAREMADGDADEWDDEDENGEDDDDDDDDEEEEEDDSSDS